MIFSFWTKWNVTLTYRIKRDEQTFDIGKIWSLCLNSNSFSADYMHVLAAKMNKRLGRHQCNATQRICSRECRRQNQLTKKSYHSEAKSKYYNVFIPACCCLEHFEFTIVSVYVINEKIKFVIWSICWIYIVFNQKQNSG